MQPTANRIPRITPARTGLCRRLQRWWVRVSLQARVTQLELAEANLQHHMALDLATALALQLEYKRSPVLQQRMQGDTIELGRLQGELIRVRLAMTELEFGL